MLRNVAIVAACEHTFFNHWPMQRVGAVAGLVAALPKDRVDRAASRKGAARLQWRSGRARALHALGRHACRSAGPRHMRELPQGHAGTPRGHARRHLPGAAAAPAARRGRAAAAREGHQAHQDGALWPRWAARQPSRWVCAGRLGGGAAWRGGRSITSWEDPRIKTECKLILPPCSSEPVRRGRRQRSGGRWVRRAARQPAARPATAG